MFTGIIEELATVKDIAIDGTNKNIQLSSSITHEFKIDQSISHNGVCLTITEISGQDYWVTAVKETLQKSNIGHLSIGDIVNIERSLRVGDRLDGHMVQGHVDTTGIVRKVEEQKGSWMFHFAFDPNYTHLIVPKGSICINGVSLTIVDAGHNFFSVTIIPYTYEHTNFNKFQEGTEVNLEFDILGKYIHRYQEKISTAS